MKYIVKLAIAAVAAFGFVACEEERDKTQLAQESSFVSPVLDEIGDVIVESNNTSEGVTFAWSSASFGVSTEILYTLYLTYNGNSAAVGTSSYTSMSVSKKDLNGTACATLGAAKNATTTVGAYIQATINGVSGYSVQSNAISFDITTFDAPKSCLYLPGYYQGWSADATDFWETEGGNGIYSMLVTFAEDATNTPSFCPFKLYDGTDWLGYNDGYSAEWGDDDFFSNSDGNFAVPVGEETNIITLNNNTKTFSRTVVTKVGLIGDFSPSDWSEDVEFTYDASSNTWKTEPVTFEAGKEFLIRLNGDWADADKFGGATTLSSEVSGGYYELENSGSAANISIDTFGGAGTYVMVLVANHTPYVLKAEKQ